MFEDLAMIVVVVVVLIALMIWVAGYEADATEFKDSE